MNWQQHSQPTPTSYHLFTRFRIGQSEFCPCQTGSMTTEHLLKACPLHNNLRRQFWPVETQVVRKLFSSLDNLQHTPAFVQRAEVSIWMTEEKEVTHGEQKNTFDNAHFFRSSRCLPLVSFIFLFISQLCCPIGISPMGNLGCFPLGKPVQQSCAT